MQEMRKVSIFFFPHIAGGHLLPMIDAARFIATHPDVQVTIITTSKNAQAFQHAIDRDRDAGHDISFHIVELPKAKYGLPDDVENLLSSISAELRFKVFKAVLGLKEPLIELLLARRPDCLISDVVQSWTLDVANKAGIPRIAFRVTSAFAVCAGDSMEKFKPHETVGSDDEPFVLPGLPDKVSTTRRRHPFSQSDQNVVEFFNEIHQAERDSYGVMINSFADLENEYLKYMQNVMGWKLWAVGPVSRFSNRNISDKSARGTGKSTVEEVSILGWLESKGENSVVYVSFGSEVNLSKDQFHEIAHGLEASGHPFIWVARTNIYRDQSEEGWFPEGFEQKVKDSNMGLIIKGWAPQLLILEHPSVGVFLTHSGWNSSTESLCVGVPLITWPIAVDQFPNEILLVDVLKVGIRVGSEECLYMSLTLKPPKVTVSRDKIEVAVRRMLSNEEEVVEIRRRVQDLADKSNKAVEEGGSSHRDVCALVDELKARRREFVSTTIA